MKYYDFLKHSIIVWEFESKRFLIRSFRLPWQCYWRFKAAGMCMLFVLVNSYQMTQRNILNDRSYQTITDFSTRFCSVKKAAMCFFDTILSHGRGNFRCLYRHTYQFPNLPSMEETLKYLHLHPEETLHMKISTDQKTKRQLIKQGHYSSTVNYRTSIPETF